MPTANYSLFYSITSSWISKKERRAPGTSPFLWVWILFFFLGRVFFFFARGAHGFLRYIRCKPIFILYFWELCLGFVCFFVDLTERVKYLSLVLVEYQASQIPTVSFDTSSVLV